MDEKEIKALQDTLAKLTEQTAGYETEIKEVRKELEALKALPASKVTLPGVRSNETFLGYKLSNQGLDLKTKDEEKKDRIAKWVISQIRMADRGKDWTNDIRKTYGDNALNEGDPASGGYTVPVEYSAEIMGFARLVSFALNECQVWPMSSMTKKVPKENALVSVAWTAEEVDLTETEPTFDEMTLTAKKLGGVGLMSNELLQDSEVDIVSILTSQFGEAIGQELDNQVLNGTGSPVSGLLTAACGLSVIMTPGNAFSAITGNYLSDMIAKIPINKIAGARFVIGRVGLSYLRVNQSSAGGYLWGAMADPDRNTLWGFPYIVTERVTNTTGTTTAFVLFGNLKNFAIGNRLTNMTLDLDPYSYFKSYRTQYRIVSRFALAIGQSSAFVRLLTGSV
jgi:HK97 family phage major capsid protein